MTDPRPHLAETGADSNPDPNPDSGPDTGPPSRERNLILGAIAAAAPSTRSGVSAGSVAASVDELSDVPTSAVDPSSFGPASMTPMGGGLRAGSSDADPHAKTSAGGPGGSGAGATEFDALKHTFPGYEILDEIHRGGQGVVYKALQLTTKRKVAIKVMHGGATLGSAGKARFEREVLVLGQLNHPNIVKLHDSGTTPDGSFFYVMDYISGKPLDQVLREQRREAKRALKDTHSRSRSRVDVGPSIRETLGLFAKICDAVNAAHLRGVIHRDLKPANVRIDARGEPIVVDFGLAKTAAGVESDIDAGEAMTMTGQFVGSLPWASPEQAAGGGEAMDVRTDVYSLGVMLYQMLTGGKFPYAVVGNIRDVLDNIQRVEPAPPSTIRKRINDEVETIVLKALAKERERRYQNAGELGRDLGRYLRGEAIEAKRDSGWYLVQKMVRRHKVPAAFVATVAVLTVGFGAGMSGLYARAETARAGEAEQKAIAVAERDRAEDNLDAIRDLARTFIFDFSGAIEDLRGATRAREIVLEKALEYLARMEAQASEDPAYLLDLADAHEEVGRLRGAMYAASTGTTGEAVDHFARAREIRERVLEAQPGNERARLGIARGRMAEAGTLQKRGAFNEAVAALDEAGELAAAAGDGVIAAESSFRKGDLYRRMAVSEGDAERALGLLDRAEPLYGADRVAAWVDEDPGRRVGLILHKRMQVEITRGRLLDDAEASLAALRHAAELGTEAVETLGAEAERRPADWALGHDLFVATWHLGRVYADSAKLARGAGREREADELEAKALETYRAAYEVTLASAGDAANLEAQRDLSIATNNLADALRDAGASDEAIRLLGDNLVHTAGIMRTDPIVRHERDLMVVEFKLANHWYERARAATDPTGRASDAQRAMAHLANARRILDSLAGQGLGVANETRAIDQLGASIRSLIP